jgi:hypothetical protein
MGIFSYEDFHDEWAGFNDLNATMFRVREDTADLEPIKAIFRSVPEHLKAQSLAYALEYAINSLSAVKLNLAKDLGAMELITPKNSLQVALRIRDCLFSRNSHSDGDHVELLKDLAADHGLHFAIDTMAAALNSHFAERRYGAKMVTAQNTFDGYVDNFLLMDRFIDPAFKKSVAVANVGFKAFAQEAFRYSPRPDSSLALKLLAEYDSNDLVAIGTILKEQPESGDLLARQIDSGFISKGAQAFKENSDSVIRAFKVRPLTAISMLDGMTSDELTDFVQSPGLYAYASGAWVEKGNAHVLGNKELISLVDRFNSRLVSSPYFSSVFDRSSELSSPWTTAIPYVLLSKSLADAGIHVDIRRSDSSSSQAVDSLADALDAMEGYEAVVQHRASGLKMLQKELDQSLRRAYREMSADEDLGKRIKEPRTTANPGGVDPEYQRNFAAVRLCAELYQERQTVATEKKKLTPYAYFVGDIKGPAASRKALTQIVKSLDEETILDALAHYKAGFRPLIEIGVLDKKHMNKLNLKDRGRFLETDMGM